MTKRELFFFAQHCVLCLRKVFFSSPLHTHVLSPFRSSCLVSDDRETIMEDPSSTFRRRNDAAGGADSSGGTENSMRTSSSSAEMASWTPASTAVATAKALAAAQAPGGALALLASLIQDLSPSQEADVR